MKAVVVYESLWGNTAAIARAIAEGIAESITEGIGPDAQALPTDQATDAIVAEADLIVAGAPVHAFTLPTEGMRNNLGPHEAKAPTQPDLSHPSMRSWLSKMPKGNGRSAAFETRMRWSPGGATPAITRGLKRAGFSPVVKRERFIVKGIYGPLRDGELDRARAWGAELARAMK